VGALVTSGAADRMILLCGPDPALGRYVADPCFRTLKVDSVFMSQVTKIENGARTLNVPLQEDKGSLRSTCTQVGNPCAKRLGP